VFCLDGGDILMEGTFLGPDLGKQIRRRLQIADQYPDLCQAAIDAVYKIEAARLDGAVSVARAECLGCGSEFQYRPWLIVVVSVASLLLGVVAGVSYAH